MKKVAAEPYRNYDFSRARRGSIVPAELGKRKISIRLDNRVLDHFRAAVESAGGGNYQTLINDALIAYIRQESILTAVRRVVREELALGDAKRRALRARLKTRSPLKGGMSPTDIVRQQRDGR